MIVSSNDEKAMSGVTRKEKALIGDLPTVSLRVKEQWCSDVFRNSYFHHPAVPRDLIGSNRHIRMLSAPFFIFGVPLTLAKEAQKGPKIT